jgi:hypothetical protein
VFVHGNDELVSCVALGGFRLLHLFLCVIVPEGLKMLVEVEVCGECADSENVKCLGCDERCGNEGIGEVAI